MNTSQKFYLMPHKCMYIGWGLFAFSFVYLFACLNFSKVLSQLFFNPSDTRIYVVPLYLMLFSSALLVAFAKEKIEDEFIQSIRLGSIVVTAYISFIFFILLNVFMVFYTGFKPYDSKPMNLLIYNMITSGINPISMFMLYVIIFRTRMYKYYKSCKNEE